MTRLAIAAGKYYPADKTDLINQINSFLGKAESHFVKATKNEEGKIRILIVPHAGYNYSGQTAGWGFKELEKTNFARIILLGASHQTYFENIAIYNKGAWQTPLGKVKIDENLANAFLPKADLVSHQQEHSLEVEIPFLQQVLKNFKIVPILLGHISEQALKALADSISNNFNEQTLLIISSDLSHYPSYNIANQIDKETIEAILSGQIDRFDRIIQENQGKRGVDTCACGADIIKVGMMVAKNLNIKDIKLLNYSNSGDTGGDKLIVVGYASIGFYGKSLELRTKNLELSKNQQKQLLRIARETLESYLRDKTIPKISSIGRNSAFQKKLGAFVTLKTKTGQLRGCIGEFEQEKPLYKVVQDKIIDAAINDPRFDKVKYEELKNINIEISVLSPKKKIDDWKKIKLGRYGVIIKKDSKGGTFLPQVAKENNWNLETFLSTLCFHKAGLSSDCYKDPKTEIYIFTAQVFSEKK